MDEPSRPSQEPSPGTLGPAPTRPDLPAVERPDGPAQHVEPALPQPLAGPPEPNLRSAPPAPPPQRTAWGARLAVLGITAFSAVVGWLAATRFLPRWWAQRIGNVADGTFTAGISAGLACGVAFTLMPLLVLRGAVRRRATWTARFAFVVLALLLSVPNLITLGVVLGTNNAAHAAERTFDVEAPGFRGATLVGAVLGAGLAVAFWLLRWRAGRRRHRISALEAELAERDRRAKDAIPPSGTGIDKG